MKKIKNIFLFILPLFFVGCVDDLDTQITDPDVILADQVYQTKADYLSGLAKVYAAFATTGQAGPAGQGDISDIDEGASAYLRGYWQLQELPTDEAVIAWNDGNLPRLNFQQWSSSNEFINAFYNRVFFSVAAANEFIRESAPEKVSERGITGADAEEIATFRLEARFLRALVYMHGIDLFGDLGFVTDEDPVGIFFPEQVAKAEIFTFIESELLEIEQGMLSPMSIHGRADKGAVWMTLAKLYLNAEIYTGENRYSDAITQLNNVFNAGYSLDSDYDELFMTDNFNSNEIIFPIVFDGVETQTFGGTTYLAHAAVGGSMDAAEYGIDFGWGGNRTTSALVDLFEFSDDDFNSPDDRANFYTDGQSKEINQVIDQFTDGFAIEKFVNISSTGEPGSNVTFVDTDFPLFRLADAYLMYAESVLRGGSGGSSSQALTYINLLRERAYGDTSGNISAGDLTLDFVLDERARELYWEGHRRTDLIRYGYYTDSNFTWPWKGGIQDGVSTQSFYDLYPIPSAQLLANPNLTQNPGY